MFMSICDKEVTKMNNNKFKECSCDICNRNTDNWNKRFIKYNGEWYCEKHYAQLKRKGYIVKYTIGKYGAINDMPYGWSKENELNQRIYILWNDVIRRCYSEKIHKKQPCYKQCTCEEFLKLSNFVVLIKEIENYELWRDNKGKYELDKDIKSNGKCKKYSVDNCMFVLKAENVAQSCRTRNVKGKKNPRARKVGQFDLSGNLIKIWNCAKEISEANKEINYSTLRDYLQDKRIKNEYNGYVWKYIE